MRLCCVCFVSSGPGLITSSSFSRPPIHRQTVCVINLSALAQDHGLHVLLIVVPLRKGCH
ncbi:hypothetical protein PF005_g11168 [Phytophthora fragariae]|uniref:Uncharacterized protein n=2 Tax=Phytophthora TaxID=4783 RepID=A0A6A3ZCR5_9STRA|nr:hypothetical protein PF003_g354 [Phytophthora fragariae]KAE9033343.1 hypothetical protein PR002_g8714 [Phytophthora rubi]KAE8940943.1 hypothetical protein PF009_g9262 [Phytophthora fragariae]KAE9010050.1 hypothetical protein PF011_g9995 [Phytophthora fragariae]KAE9037680.1 hypothetical protein PR001_g8280 [Phytophthora rubi]